MLKGKPTTQQFDELRHEFVKATDFGKFWETFLDDWAERPEFIEMGTKISNPRLEAIVKQTCDAMLRRKTRQSMIMLVSVPEGNLIHGAFSIDGAFGGLLVFPDLGKGMVTVSYLDGGTEFARFSIQMEMAATVQ